MNNSEPKIYCLDENISFHICGLNNKTNSLIKEDCTRYVCEERNGKIYYFCSQEGIHFHCTKHPAIELEYIGNQNSHQFAKCRKCDIEINIGSKIKLIEECLRLLNIERLKDAKLIRLDDWYVPEIKHKEKSISHYWLNCEVKTDKDGDTLIVLYIGKKDSNEKSQFFIKPEKLQLTTDHKDLDPATILSKIEVTLKDRTLTQEYNV